MFKSLYPLNKTFKISYAKILSDKSFSTLVESIKSSWPKEIREESNITSNNSETLLPERTIPEDKLKFRLTSSFFPGSSIHFPHMPSHPGDFKVALTVSIDELNLNDIEKSIFMKMMGPRFNPGKREIKLTGNKFPNRIENKRYLIVLLENLLNEVKKLAKTPDDEKLRWCGYDIISSNSFDKKKILWLIH